MWCEASMAWLTKLWETYGEEATGIHFVKGVDVSGEGAPAVTHPYWAHCVKDFRLLDSQEAEKICPGTAHGSAFETIIYNPTYVASGTYFSGCRFSHDGGTTRMLPPLCAVGVGR